MHLVFFQVETALWTYMIPSLLFSLFTIVQPFLRLVTGIISDIIGIKQWHYLYVFSAPNICIWILTWSGCGLNQNGGVLWGFSSWKLCRALGEKTDVEISAVSARCVNSDSSLDSYLVTSLLDVITDVISGAVVQSHCGTWSGFYY